MSQAIETATGGPFDQYRGRVLPEWIDLNGHMNVAYYLLAFDQATDTFYSALGVGWEYKEATSFSTFALEGHITYDREVKQGDPLRIRTFLLGFDAKRIHYIHEMYHADEGYLAATNEMLGIHIDMSIRRSAPWRDDALARLQATREVHRHLRVPPHAGRRVSLDAKRPGA